ncbi:MULTISPECIES: PepSY domain-containing protein [Bacteria]|uniref:PepSY domain-containing protein n=1 Tax=Bacteria TaxID=2 RepID=UPI00103DCD21|nr:MULTISPECIES: PepSY domain-containing protein [Bacteria]QDM40468.1 PepSY domain-containing protein [Altererythrobacter sp. TH136]TCJ39020.1 hypothetical protein E0504_12080 [Parafrankia sp. BMG5.11]
MNKPVASLLALMLAPALAVTALLAPAAPALAQRNDQGEARKEMRAGNVLSLRQIESRVVPTMDRQQYLGPAYDATAMAYRLKFIDQKGHVTYVDVDARTGRVLGVTR